MFSLSFFCFFLSAAKNIRRQRAVPRIRTRTNRVMEIHGMGNILSDGVLSNDGAMQIAIAILWSSTDRRL